LGLSTYTHKFAPPPARSRTLAFQNSLCATAAIPAKICAIITQKIMHDQLSTNSKKGYRSKLTSTVSGQGNEKANGKEKKRGERHPIPPQNHNSI